jgi:hypothetical protein
MQMMRNGYDATNYSVSWMTEQSAERPFFSGIDVARWNKVGAQQVGDFFGVKAVVLVLAPVPLFIGHSQRVAGGGLADAGVIEFRAEGRQTGFDVPQTFATRKLGERQPEELFVSGQLADAKLPW